MDRGWKNFEAHDRKSLVCLEETIARNMDIKGSSGESSGRSEEHGRETAILENT